MGSKRNYVRSTSVCLSMGQVEVDRYESKGPVSMKTARRTMVKLIKSWRDWGGMREPGKPLDSDFRVRPGTVHFSTNEDPQSFRWYSITDKPIPRGRKQREEAEA